jgi:hypothetical protein
MTARTRVALLLLALAVFAAACAKDAEPGTSPSEGSTTGPTGSETSPAPVTGATGSGSPTETQSPSEAPSPELEDGRHFGSIESVDVENQTLVFDLAYFLTGDEANQAAAEHGDEVPVPNDYYIVNDNPRLRTLDVAPNVEVRVIDWTNCCELVQGEVQPFMDAFATNHHAWDALYKGSEAPYWLTVEGGVVVKIEVQYLP